MIYFLIFIYMFVLPIIIIIMLSTLIAKIRELDKFQRQINKIPKRVHSNIQKSNYDNSFGGRKAYEKYQNKNGLYEPIIPSRGIRIKEE